MWVRLSLYYCQSCCTAPSSVTSSSSNSRLSRNCAMSNRTSAKSSIWSSSSCPISSSSSSSLSSSSSGSLQPPGELGVASHDLFTLELLGIVDDGRSTLDVPHFEPRPKAAVDALHHFMIQLTRGRTRRILVQRRQRALEIMVHILIRHRPYLLRKWRRVAEVVVFMGDTNNVPSELVVD